MNHAFVIHASDNVATALTDLPTGPVQLTGETPSGQAEAIEPIQSGHKLALTAIQPGEPVVKYDSIIGEATQPIAAGQWVHLHNMRSRFDERASTFDVHTGAPTEPNVYV